MSPSVGFSGELNGGRRRFKIVYYVLYLWGRAI